MTIRKTILRFDGDGSAALTDTGREPVFGSIDQVRWIPTAQDTGPANIGTLTLFLGKRPIDTGLAQIVWSEGSLVLGNDITRVPRQFTHDVSGAEDARDTGTPALPTPVYGCGDSLTARFTAGDTGLIAGELQVYHGAVGGHQTL
jgi:hypothetical protein